MLGQVYTDPKAEKNFSSFLDTSYKININNKVERSAAELEVDCKRSAQKSFTVC